MFCWVAVTEREDYELLAVFRSGRVSLKHDASTEQACHCADRHLQRFTTRTELIGSHRQSVRFVRAREA